jgi:polyol permease family
MDRYSPADTHGPHQTTSSPWERLGIPRQLRWGFVGLLFFMIGDGVESGILSPYLIHRGLSPTSVAWIFSFYGIAVAIAGWLSGALSDVWGPRHVIKIGLSLWLIFEILFLTFGLGRSNVSLILITYSLRGLGYPLFAFGFLVWITVVAPQERLASAMGWFWFAFTGGLPTLGSLVASLCVPKLGVYTTFWVATLLVAMGGTILLIGVREPRGAKRLVPPQERPVQSLFRSVAIAWQKPKTGLACIVRMINTAPEFGFLVFLPIFFTQTMGFPMVKWLHLLSAIFFSNIVWNLLFGIIGDRIGWARTVAYFGGFGCTLTTLALYYVPTFYRSYEMSLLVGILYGATLAGYVPLSALMTSLAPDHKGAALSLLNLGAGASVWLGPAIVGILLRPLGVVGVMWVFAALYLLSGILALTLKLATPDKTSARLAEAI